jgi:protein SCO1/2
MWAVASTSTRAGASATTSTNAPPTAWVQPRLPAPPFRITRADGRQVTLAGAVAGKVTAVQLMFTGCSSTCPVQGALFAAMANRLRSTDVQFLSISIDALGDTPAALTAWQARFGQAPGWNAAVADPAHVDQLADFMKGVAGKRGTHTAQVFIFDRQSRLCYRTGDSPAIGDLEALLSQAAQLS